MATATENQQTDHPMQQVAVDVAKLRLAHEAMMLADAQAVLKADRAGVNAHNKEMLGAECGAPSGDDMIHIGNVTYTQQQPAPQPASTGMSTLGKVATGAALLLGGAGVGAAIPLAIDALRPEPAVEAPEFVDTDTDTQFRLVLPDAKGD